MSVNLTKLLEYIQGRHGVAPTVREYERHLGQAKGSGLEIERGGYNKLANLYYDLVTDFYEYGWGRSFHFGPLVPGESSGHRSLAMNTTWPTYSRSAPGWSLPISVTALGGR